jgi:hypothetical protein
MTFTHNQTQELWHDVPILAIDPGKMSGWAYLDNNSFSSGQEDFETICEFIEYHTDRQGKKNFEAPQRLRVVTEKFIITIHTGKNSQAPWSLEVNGVARFFALKNNLVYAEQTASEAKTFASNGMLQALGWYKPGKVHANDAARHLVLFGLSRKIFFHPNLKQFFEPQA